jgi:hypothetical protein
VQIPDSNLERASKIFQSVYMASQESWEFPSPASSSIRSDLKRDSPVKTRVELKETGVMNISEHMSLADESPAIETTAPLVIRRNPPQIPLPSELKRRSRAFVTTRGRKIAFPVKRHPHRFNGAVLDLTDEDSGSDGDDEDDVWDDDVVSADEKGRKLTLKDPTWEMITPPSRI